MFLNWREMNPDKAVNLNGRTGGVKWNGKVSSYRTEVKCNEIASREMAREMPFFRVSYLSCAIHVILAQNSNRFFSFCIPLPVRCMPPLGMFNPDLGV